MKRRSAASVEERRSGKFRVRARIDGKLQTVATADTRAEAEELADAYQQVRHERDLHEGLTLAQFGEGFLKRRERAGVRGIRVDRNRWKNYVENDPIGALPVATLARRDVKEWLDRRVDLAYTTQSCALNLLRVALGEAVDRELLEANPARDVKVHRSAKATSKDPLDGILNPDEQRALVAAVPELERPAVVFALCTGLRQSEQWWLRWEDVFADHVLVRRSAGGLPTKSGKPRRVPLLPAARAALDSLDRRSPWVFPARRGARRQNGKPPRGWSKWLEKAGITRPVRWHDLRHTCATSLLAGWWSPEGRRWSLDAVSKLLGHSSVQVTERYARKLDSTLADAVATTAGPMFPTGSKGVAQVPGMFLVDPRFRKAQVLGSNPSVGSSTYEIDGEQSGNFSEEDFAAAIAEHRERVEADLERAERRVDELNGGQP